MDTHVVVSEDLSCGSGHSVFWSAPPWSSRVCPHVLVDPGRPPYVSRLWAWASWRQSQMPDTETKLSWKLGSGLSHPTENTFRGPWSLSSFCVCLLACVQPQAGKPPGPPCPHPLSFLRSAVTLPGWPQHRLPTLLPVSHLGQQQLAAGPGMHWTPSGPS